MALLLIALNFWAGRGIYPVRNVSYGVAAVRINVQSCCLPVRRGIHRAWNVSYGATVPWINIRSCCHTPNVQCLPRPA